MQPARPRHRYSYGDYLAYERDSGLKHEFEGGEILAMAGGSRRHNALASRVVAALENGRKAGCVAFQSDQKVRILATGKATYPDASMVCGPIEGDTADPSGCARHRGPRVPVHRKVWSAAASGHGPSPPTNVAICIYSDRMADPEASGCFDGHWQTTSP
jgi:hypothetical protein